MEMNNESTQHPATPKVICYVRVAKDDPESGAEVEAQSQACKDFARLVNLTVAEMYVDNGSRLTEKERAPRTRPERSGRA